jgi:hypothetical protein
MDAEPGSETERALRGVATETDAMLSRLTAARAELEAQPLPGLSEADGMALERFAQEVNEGIEAANPAERRRIYQLLRLQGKVREDAEHGRQLGRRHRFSIEWDAVIQLFDGERANKKVRLRYFIDAYQEWDAKYMLAAAG